MVSTVVTAHGYEVGFGLVGVFALCACVIAARIPRT